ncbi:MAG: TonB-dependent receptor [Prolixibacteraceae bacterium]
MKKNQECREPLGRTLKKIWRIMRWSVFFLIISIFHASAISGYAQKAQLSLDFRNTSIETILNEIENQSEFYFLYNKNLIDVKRKVDIQVRNLRLSDVLDQLFENTSVDYQIIGRQIALINGQGPSAMVTAQQRPLSGKVTNSQKEPLPGVSVTLKGTNQGSITDAEGGFSFKAIPDNAVLVFSFVGMKSQEVAVAGKSVISVMLEDENVGIEEVVAIGYGTQRKVTMTGSVSTLKGDKIIQSPAINISNSIAGRVTGVIANNRSGEPGSDWSTILIRGKGTLGDNSPLYVIDGVANRDNLERLNPADIESVSILKDASAAIYGAQAANGVILITTKRGNTGKPTITYDGNYGFSQPTRLPDLMNAYQYMVYQDEARAFEGKSLLYEEVKEKYLNGTIDHITLADTDWMSVLFRDFAPQTQHSLSVRGGNEKVKYFVSGGYVRQEPLYRSTVGNNYHAGQIRSNIDASITNNLTVSVELAGRRENRYTSDYSSEKIFTEAFNVYPYVPAYYPNGLPTAGISKGLNPAILSSGITGYYRNIDYFLNSKAGFDLKLPWITKGLSVSGYVAFDAHFGKDKTFHNHWDAYQYVMDDAGKITGYENIRDQTNEYGTISLDQSAYDSEVTTSNLKLAYEKRIGHHQLSAFVAFEQSQQKGENIWAYRRDYLSGQIQLLSAGSSELKDNSGSANHSARQNYFSRIEYNYNDKYLATFTVRRDGSSNFHPDHRWGTFPALSVGWRISEENFLKDNLAFVSNLKLRASWGKLGNDRTNPYQYLSTYALADAGQIGNPPVKVKGFYEGVTPNVNITWETIDSKNIGVEGSLWNGALTFDLNWFHAGRTGILITKDASVPSFTGISLPSQNLGEVVNRGVEAEISHKGKIGNVGYYIGGNATFARNKVIYMDEAADVPEWQKKEGHPMDSWMVFPTDGLYQTWEEVENTPHLENTQPGDVKYVDTDGDQSITGRDMVRIYKSPTPELVFGIPMGFSWNGFELNALWQGQAMARQFLLPQSLNIDVDYFNGRWISAEETPNAKYPRAYTYEYPIMDQMLEYWLRDASFIRLKNLELAYTFKSGMLQDLQISNLRLYISGSNLFTLDHMKLVDPELSPGNFGGKYYPQTRIFNVGVNLSF